MTYKSLLCHVPPNAAQAAHVACAASLADDLEALVIGVGAAAVPPFALRSGGAYGAVDNQWLSLLQEQITTALESAHQVFEDRAGARSKAWRAHWVEPARALAEAARAADLIVVAHSADRTDVYTEVDVGQLIMKAGRPVLICPTDQNHLGDGPVLVAWKDSREARRAIADALPLLQRSRDVLVVECSQDSETSAIVARLEDVAAALGRHGVMARTAVLDQTGKASDVILERAAMLGAVLIVAGAYGHTRLGEWAFGGVTRDLLEQNRFFVLLSH